MAQKRSNGTMDLFPRVTVGVMGSAGGALQEEVCERVRTFGALVG